MNMYDLHVCPAKDKLKDFIEMAGKLGLKGIAFTPKFENKEELESSFKKLEELEENTDLDVIKGVEIETNNVKNLKKQIYKVREMSEIIVIKGGNYKINRVACEDSRVDILAHPEYKRSDSGLDDVLAKNASENEVYIEINFHEILTTYGKVRAHVLSHIQKNVKLAEKFDSPLIICSGAKDEYELRGLKEFSAVLELVGLNRKRSKNIVENVPKNIVEKNRKKLSGKVKFEGVEEVE